MRRGRTEWQYRCPFCIDLVGTPDRNGALYFNTTKQVGACWRCRTVVLGTGPVDMAAIRAIYDRQRQTQVHHQRYNLVNWSRPATAVDWAMDYLTGRGFTADTIDRYAVRAAESPQRCIVLPDEIAPDGTTNFFQVRYLEARRNKYDSPSDSVKPVYGLSRALPHARAIVSEGCFSAIAMAQAAGPDWIGLATYGKQASDYQIAQLQDAELDCLCLAYDGGEFDAMLDGARALLGAGKAVRIVMLPFGQDPNSCDADTCRDALRHSYPATMLSLAALEQRRLQLAGQAVDGRAWESLRNHARAASTPIDTRHEVVL